MTDTYEGWSNHATWLVSLYIDNDLFLYGEVKQMVEDTLALHDRESTKAMNSLASVLETFIHDELTEFLTPNMSPLFSDLFLDALHRVDFTEIAQHLLVE